MPVTPNMNLTLPTPTVTPGPLYASENNQAFTVIDSHDHSPGYGVPIPSAGISINADLPFSGFNASSLRSTIFSNQTVPLTLPTDIRSLYSVNGDLYYNNGIGQAIQLTIGAALNATSIGGIGGDYATSTASAFYTSFISTFTFWSASNTPAAIDAGPLTIRTITPSPFGITLNSPGTLSADYALTLPSALPASTKFLTVDSSGNIGDVYDVDNVSININSNLIQIADGGVTNVKIGDGEITNNKIADNTITQSKFNSFLQNVSGTSLVYNVAGSVNNLVIPSNISRIYITAAGGGGAGGYGNPSGYGGGGGGGGGLIMGFFSVIPGETLTITVADISLSNIGAAGSNGNPTTIVGSSSGTIVSANGGGGGGLGALGSGGAGGAPGGFGSTGYPGNAAISAGPGGAGYAQSGFGSLGVSNYGGQGGQAATGGGGGGGGSYGAGGAGGANGQSGVGYGGGGGGGNGTNRTGGNGASGIVIIDII